MKTDLKIFDILEKAERMKLINDFKRDVFGKKVMYKTSPNM